MFVARLRCCNCGFETQEFVLGYLPSRDSLDLVFRNRLTNDLRIVTCSPVLGDYVQASEDDAAWRAAKARLAAEHVRDSESEIEIWNSRSDLSLPCPRCNQNAVSVAYEGII